MENKIADSETHICGAKCTECPIMQFFNQPASNIHAAGRALTDNITGETKRPERFLPNFLATQRRKLISNTQRVLQCDQAKTHAEVFPYVLERFRGAYQKLGMAVPVLEYVTDPSASSSQ